MYVMQEEINIAQMSINIGVPVNSTGNLLESTNTHKYYAYDEHHTSRSIIKRIAAEITNRLYHSSNSPRKLEKEDKKFTISWGEGKKIKSEPISFKKIERQIIRERTYIPFEFKVVLYL